SYTPGSGRGRGGWGSPEDMANMADAMFRRADKNGDGVLSNDELSDILRNERERFDTNGDGVIDINDFRAFIAARAQQWPSARANNPMANAPMNGGSSRSFGNRWGEGSPSFDPNTAMSMLRGGTGSFNTSSSRSFDPNSFPNMNRGDRTSPS